MSGNKIFISYKYSDHMVAKLESSRTGTARDYVDWLQENRISGDDINKGEKDGEDLSQFSDDTIWTKLKEKIWDSSITIVLISKGMLESGVDEKDQWIPWEISYSLRTETRNQKRSNPNAVLAVVLPDENNSYDYFLEDSSYEEDGNSHPLTIVHTCNTFKIISDNMFNEKNPNVKYVDGEKIYSGDCNYISFAKWEDFLDKESIDYYLEKAAKIREKIDDYDITVNIK